MLIRIVKVPNVFGDIKDFHKTFRGRFDAWKNSDGNFDYKTMYTMLAWRGLMNTPQGAAMKKDPKFMSAFNQAFIDAKDETKNCPQ
ncbi:hypothetical protein [Alistipes sp. ZOR0009]|uniref:hypothetical protein n=1 Tax=Alistipes sp. ZOR0009 TaxID=1339253 RepID=UPI00064677C5|nr:hypothetical protein [Alistipes sp. ZOR0009]